MGTGKLACLYRQHIGIPCIPVVSFVEIGSRFQTHETAAPAGGWHGYFVQDADLGRVFTVIVNIYLGCFFGGDSRKR